MRISATDLEAYRLYLQEDWMTFDALLARVKREDAPSEKMERGTALHEFLERAQCGDEVEEFEAAGVRFKFELDCALHLPVMREVKTEKTLFLNGEEITLVAKTDAIEGRKVWDHKLTEDFDAERYTDSLQWRVYLWLFDADTFVYNVFVARESKQKQCFVVKELHTLTCCRYDGMEDDVRKWVREYAGFLRQHAPEVADDPEGKEKQLPF